MEAAVKEDHFSCRGSEPSWLVETSAGSPSALLPREQHLGGPVRSSSMSVVLGPAILLSPWYASLPMRGWAGTSHGHYFLVAYIWLPHFWNTSDGSLVSTSSQARDLAPVGNYGNCWGRQCLSLELLVFSLFLTCSSFFFLLDRVLLCCSC